MNKTLCISISSAILAIHAFCAPAQAQERSETPLPSSEEKATMPPPEPAPAEAPFKRVGIGYKMGNGIGFLGADLIVTALPNVTLDVQVATVGGFDSAFAIAPAIQGHLRPRGNSPYVAVGLQHIRVTLDEVKASGTGYFANIGYEWKWDAGLGILLGGGVQYIDEINASSGTQTARLEGGVNPNLELGLRYRFL